ncbi:hypothetical protein GCM10022226_47060 [Sphaerisporangium flaviroseum]|uniref:DUF3040 domain-containing protein n=1 Tax=Sphaerisporangium flaviroseum TaxID=509199 RepID=A0ABP7IM10_9ACTN
MTATPEPQTLSIDGVPDDIIKAAEIDLAEQRAAVKVAKDRVRQLRRRERRLRRRAQLHALRRGARVTAMYGLIVTGLIFFVIAGSLLINGQGSGLAWFAGGTAAWSTAASLRR